MFSFDSRKHHFDDVCVPIFQMGETDLTDSQRQQADRVSPYKGDVDPGDASFQFADLGLPQVQAMG